MTKIEVTHIGEDYGYVTVDRDYGNPSSQVEQYEVPRGLAVALKNYLKGIAPKR